MLGSTLMFAGMAITIRLAAADLHAFEIAFFRNLFGLFFALPLLRRAGLGVLRSHRMGLYLVRCLIGLGAMLCGFWSLVHLPLGQAIALSYATPLFVTIGAVLVLGEVVRLRRWTAVAIGFVGVLIIVRPGVSEVSLAVLVALASAALAASAAITIKFLSRTEPAEAIVIWMVLIMTPLSLIPAIPVWSWPSNGLLWLWLVLTGLLGTAGHTLLTEHPACAGPVNPLRTSRLRAAGHAIPPAWSRRAPPSPAARCAGRPCVRRGATSSTPPPRSGPARGSGGPPSARERPSQRASR